MLGKPVSELETLLTPKQMPEDTPPDRQDRYRVIAKGLTPEQWRAVQAVAVPGISSEITSLRTYPAGAPTAALLGFVGASGRANAEGGMGLERKYDDVLTGTPGVIRREISGDGRTIPLGNNVIVPAVPGRDLKLTIDRDLTWYAYNQIAAQVRKSKALSGTAVVMDRQGRVLALAQYPTFDPLHVGKKGSSTKNFAVENQFEPGSTAKVMSIGAALAEGAVNPTTPFSVDYSIKRGGSVLHDSHTHGREHLTTAGILAQSSNVGTMLVAEKLSSEKLESYFRAFGAGSLSGLGLPGETPGMLRPSAGWRGSERFTVMYGQGIAMTALQTASVFQTIANGGVRIPPSVVAATAAPDGSYESAQLPQGTRVLPDKTAAQLTVMLEAVVGEGGTAKNAMIPGYRVAGKTGTATRYNLGGYTASFIGFAPAERPEYIVAVTVERPQGGYYGGVVAGPVFRQIMAYALAKGGARPSDKLPRLYPLAVGKDAPTVAWAKEWEEAQAENRRNQERTDDPAQTAAQQQSQQGDGKPGSNATSSGPPTPGTTNSSKPSSKPSAKPSPKPSNSSGSQRGGTASSNGNR